MNCTVNNNVLPTSVDCAATLIDGSFVTQSHKSKGLKNIDEYIEKTSISLINKHLLE